MKLAELAHDLPEKNVYQVFKAENKNSLTLQ
jgi:hypothetical protein